MARPVRRRHRRESRAREDYAGGGSVSRADGVLRVVLSGKWWDMIESGEKREEYRGSHWAKKLLTVRDRLRMEFGITPNPIDQVFHTLVASRGYTSRTLTRKIKRIRWGSPRPEWSGDTVTGQCFIIELDGIA